MCAGTCEAEHGRRPERAGYEFGCMFPDFQPCLKRLVKNRLFKMPDAITNAQEPAEALKLIRSLALATSESNELGLFKTFVRDVLAITERALPRQIMSNGSVKPTP
jgi:hypothetical protein